LRFFLAGRTRLPIVARGLRTSFANRPGWLKQTRFAGF
jgi:hypothetical protein